MQLMQRRGLLSKQQFYPEAALPYCDACAMGQMRKETARTQYHTELMEPGPSTGSIVVGDNDDNNNDDILTRAEAIELEEIARSPEHNKESREIAATLLQNDAQSRLTNVIAAVTNGEGEETATELPALTKGIMAQGEETEMEPLALTKGITAQGEDMVVCVAVSCILRLAC